MQKIPDIIEVVDAHIEDMVDYKTAHMDAGDNYAYMVSETVHAQEVIPRLEAYARDWGVEDHFDTASYKPLADVIGLIPEWRDLEPEELEEALVESFEMTSGHIYGPHCNGFEIAAFNVGEVEIDVSSLTDSLTEDEFAEVIAGSEHYVIERGSSVYAYVNTDAVWFAVLNVNRFNEYVRYNFSED